MFYVCGYCYVTVRKAALICRKIAPREIHKGKFLCVSGSSDELWHLTTVECAYPPFPKVTYLVCRGSGLVNVALSDECLIPLLSTVG